MHFHLRPLQRFFTPYFHIFYRRGTYHSSCHPHIGPALSALSLSFPPSGHRQIHSLHYHTTILPSSTPRALHSLSWLQAMLLLASIIHCQAVDLLLVLGVLVLLRVVCFLLHPLAPLESMLLTGLFSLRVCGFHVQVCVVSSRHPCRGSNIYLLSVAKL